MANTHSISITQGSDNIFADLGFEAEEAEWAMPTNKKIIYSNDIILNNHDI